MTQLKQAIYNNAREDKFTMVVTIPDALRQVISTEVGPNFINKSAFEYTAWGTAVPQIEIKSSKVRYSGQSTKLSGHTRPEWPLLDVEFNIDNQYRNYWFLYYWINFQNHDAESLYDFGKLLPNDNLTKVRYTGTIDIFLKDEYNKNIMGCKYVAAFPVKLSSLNTNQQKGGILTAKVTFEYSQFIPQLFIGDHQP